MKQPCCIYLLLLFISANAPAQEFATRGKIEFEKKENLQRSFANSNMPQQARDMYPDTRITYYDLSFAGNQTIYKAGRDNNPPPLPGRQMVIFQNTNDVLYSNFITGRKVARKNIFQDDYLFEDSIPPIRWKIGQETRRIAGYECRKAIGRIYDSVYLVAFYAEELVIKGGPEGIQGLPGMILGLAIPRYNTTWFATKVELAQLDESIITTPTVKGKKLSPDDMRAKLVKKLEQLGVKDASASVSRYFRRSYFL